MPWIAGVLAGLLLHAGAVESISAYVALVIDFFVAALSLLGYRVRDNPLLSPDKLGAYVDEDEETTRLAVLSTRMYIYERGNYALGGRRVSSTLR